MKGGKNKGDFLCDLKVLELSQKSLAKQANQRLY